MSTGAVTPGRGESENEHCLDRDNKTDEHDLIYKADEIPPWYVCLAFSVQQVALVIGSLATLPKVIMEALCADDSPSVMKYETILISTTIFLSGLSTFLQTTFGIRLPLFQTLSVAYLLSAIAALSDPQWQCPDAVQNNDPNQLILPKLLNETNNSRYYMDTDGSIRDSNELWMRRMNAVQGSLIVCGIVQIIIGCSGTLGLLIRYISPIAIAPIFVMITYGMVDVVLRLCQQNWTMLAFYTSFLLMKNIQVPLPILRIKHRKLKLSVYSRQPLFSRFPALFAITIGFIGSVIWSAVKGDSEESSSISLAVTSAPWIYIPHPFQFGLPTFHGGVIFGVMTAVVPGILESIGDYRATAVLCKERHPPKHACNRGVMMEGVGVLLCGIFGSGIGTTSDSGSIAMINISRIASRRVFQYVGLIMMVLAVFARCLSIFVAVPKPVVGGIVGSVIGMVLSVGVATLRRANMSNSRNMYIFGFSIVFGMVVSKYAQSNFDIVDVGNDEMNRIIGSILKNGMFISGTVALLLDCTSPGTRASRGLAELHSDKSGENSDRLCNTYNLPMKCNWEWTKWVPIFPKSEAVNIL